jgi:hypothetical protein
MQLRVRSWAEEQRVQNTVSLLLINTDYPVLVELRTSDP